MKKIPEYRAWLKKENRMVEVAYIDFRAKLMSYETEKCFVLAYLKDVELMLQLKLEDKKYYDKDILEFKDSVNDADIINRAVLKFDGLEWYLDNYLVDDTLVQEELYRVVDLETMILDTKVVGNEFENLELLKGK